MVPHSTSGLTWKSWIYGLIAASLLLPLSFFPARVRAAALSITTDVDELNSDGDCSLREAIQAVNLNATVDNCVWSGTPEINLPAGTYSLTLAGGSEDANTTGDLDILNDLTLTGTGSGSTIIDGAGLDRVIDIDPPSGGVGPTVVIQGVTIQNGNAPAHSGGGIQILNGTVSIINSIIANNDAGIGAGIANGSATLTITGSTVTSNNATTFGGGIRNESSGIVHLISSIVTKNTSDTQRGAGIQSFGTVTLTDSAVSYNEATTGNGGGIASFSTASLTISNSTVHDNIAGADGGGIANQGSMTIENSTISANEATDDGGGIHNLWTATATLNNVTINANLSGDLAGGVYEAGGTFNLRNTILANNTDVTGDPDCYGTFNSQGYNLIESVTSNCTISGDTTGNITGQSALLGPLADHGGPTLVHRLMTGSPAIDAGNPASPGSGGNACEAQDQRGIFRPIDGDHDTTATCDIGAYERDLVNEVFLPLIMR